MLWKDQKTTINVSMLFLIAEGWAVILQRSEEVWNEA